MLPAWVDQLRPDGLLVLPLQVGPGMYSVALRKLSGGTLISESLSPCGFIRLRGAFASAAQTVRLGNWTAELEPGPRLDPDRLATLLDQPAIQLPLPADFPEALIFLRFCGESMARLLYRSPSGGTDPEGAWDGFLDTAAMSACLLPAWTSQPPVSQLFGSRAVALRLARDLAHWEALDGRASETSAFSSSRAASPRLPQTASPSRSQLPHWCSPIATDGQYPGLDRPRSSERDRAARHSVRAGRPDHPAIWHAWRPSRGKHDLWAMPFCGRIRYARTEICPFAIAARARLPRRQGGPMPYPSLARARTSRRQATRWLALLIVTLLTIACTTQQPTVPAAPSPVAQATPTPFPATPPAAPSPATTTTRPPSPAATATVTRTAIPTRAATSAANGAPTPTGVVIAPAAFARVGLEAQAITTMAISGTVGSREGQSLFVGGKGVYRSTNAGQTWMPIRSAEDAPRVTAIAVASDKPQIIYVGVSDGCKKVKKQPGFVSKDGGETWRAIGDNLLNIVVDPNDSQHLVALSCMGLQRSDDGGGTWSPLATDHFTSFTQAALAQAPKDGQLLYAAWEEETGPIQVIRSLNGGKTWGVLELGHSLTGLISLDARFRPTRACCCCRRARGSTARWMAASPGTPSPRGWT